MRRDITNAERAKRPTFQVRSLNDDWNGSTTVKESSGRPTNSFNGSFVTKLPLQLEQGVDQSGLYVRERRDFILIVSERPIDPDVSLFRLGVQLALMDRRVVLLFWTARAKVGV